MIVKRTIYPPMWLAMALIAVFFLNEYYPGPRFTGLPGQIGGGILIVLGLFLLVGANGLFTRAGTDVIPFRNVTTLITTGLYRITRNPMYLGMVSVLLGCAITVGSASALCVPLVFAVIIDQRFIRAEENMLTELFGDQYQAYCKAVRRWL